MPEMHALMHAIAVPYQLSSDIDPVGLPVIPKESQGSFRLRSAARAAAELHQVMSFPT
jgi:hypothetical protein